MGSVSGVASVERPDVELQGLAIGPGEVDIAGGEGHCGKRKDRERSELYHLPSGCPTPGIEKLPRVPRSRTSATSVR